MWKLKLENNCKYITNLSDNICVKIVNSDLFQCTLQRKYKFCVVWWPYIVYCKIIKPKKSLYI